MNNFDSIVAGSLDIARSEVQKRKNSEIDASHLLWGLLKNPASFCSRELKSYTNEIELELSKLPSLKTSTDLNSLRPTARFSDWMTHSSSNAIQEGREDITEKDLLKFMPKIFPELEINYSKFDDGESESEVPHFLTNLNELASKGKLDPVIGRSKEIRAVMEILGRRSKNNPVLVGPAGVGKTAIVEGLAEAIVRGSVPDVLKDKTVYSLEMGSLMAGTKFRGEFEERLQGLLKFVKERSHEVILFIDELHQLVGAGKTDGAMDAANLLKPALARGELNCVGATTPEEYQKYILGDSALDRRFRSVPVNEPSKEDSIEILMGLKEKLEIHHGIKISDDAIFSSVVLSTQYIPDKNLPDKAIDLVDEAASALKLSAEAMPSKLVELQALIRSKKILAQVDKSNDGDKEEIIELERQFDEEKKNWEKEVFSVKKLSELKNRLEKYKFELKQAEREQDYETAGRLKYSEIPELQKQLEGTTHDWVLNSRDIGAVISRQKGIPLDKIMKSKQDNILNIEKSLEARVFGQKEALHEISETLIASHAGLTDPSRPLGSFLLRGPSGVGKTETAKALSHFLFDTEENLIRFDLSEFSEKHSVSKLIGAPAGYVGYDDGGVLTEAVRRKPYAVILFDEIEKAHRDFSDILLQILDDGRLTDNKGRTIDFKNTIILLTTNSKSIEDDFKAEVLGRLDAVLEFKPLGGEIVEGLIQKELSSLNERLQSKEITLSLDKSVYEFIGNRGVDSRYGARPLHSVFKKYVTRELSRLILDGTLKEGSLEGTYDKKNDKVIFT